MTKDPRLDKMAFICNICFLAAMVMRYYPLLQGTWMESMLLVAGLFISPVMNLFSNLNWLSLFIQKKAKGIQLIRVFNLVLFIVQAGLVLTGNLGNTKI